MPNAGLNPKHAAIASGPLYRVGARVGHLSCVSCFTGQGLWYIMRGVSWHGQEAHPTQIRGEKWASSKWWPLSLVLRDEKDLTS